MKRSIPAITSEPSVDESMPAIASDPSATVTKALWQFKGTTVLVMFCLIVIGSALTYLFASRTLKPLEDLTARGSSRRRLSPPTSHTTGHAVPHPAVQLT